MTTRLAGLALFIVLLLSTGLPAAAAFDMNPTPFPVWEDEVVVPGVQLLTLAAPALALDPDGRPHIVYGNKQLLHAWFDGAAWRTETVDAAHTGYRAAVVAIDEAGTLYIVDALDQRITLRTRRADGTWAPVDAPLRVGWPIASLSLALDSAGRVHIVAAPGRHERGSLLYVRHTAAGWTAETAAAEHAAGPPAIALDSQDQPLILYNQEQPGTGTEALLLARKKGGAWQQEELATGCLIVGKALALGANDEVHALFSDHCDEGRLTYVHEDGGGWQTMPVAPAGVYPALAIDSGGRPHAVYGAESAQTYAILNGAHWSAEPVQAAPYAGWHNTLVLDEADAAHIASLSADLHYATNGSGAWQISTPAVPRRVGGRSALALADGGTAHLLYHEEESGSLSWSTGQTGAWAAEQIATVPAHQLQLDIAVDSHRRPHIAYTGAAGELRVSLHEEGQWHEQIVGPAGEELALRIGRDDEPRLISVEGGRILYRWRQGETWHSEYVGGSNTAVRRARFALDSGDQPHVAYTGGAGSIYAVRQADGRWTAESLPFPAIAGLALDADDAPYFLYSEAESTGNPKYPFYYSSLHFAERRGGVWLTRYVDSEEILAWDDPIFWQGEAAIIAGSGGRVHIAYGSSGGGHTYEGRDQGGRWHVEYPGWHSEGDLHLALAADGEPRLLAHDGCSLILSTRHILLLEKHALLPLIAGT